MRLFEFVLRYAQIWPQQSLVRLFWPVSAAFAVFLAYPTVTGYQDIATLSQPGTIASAERWLAHVSTAPGRLVLGATFNAKVASRADPVTTGSVVGGNQENVEITTKTGRQPQRINRTAKGNRVVTTSFVRPPQNFKAGALLQRQSFLAPLSPKSAFDLAFAKPLANEAAIKIAAAFNIGISRNYEPAADLPENVAELVAESVPNILTYATEPTNRASPFAAVLREDDPRSLIPKLGANDHAWAAQRLPLSAFGEREQNCLTAGIYFEARGEPVRGQAAVAQVILNRVKNPAYPNSICGVVYQNKEWRNRCQFSFACDRIKDRIKDNSRWEVASYVARETTEGRIWLSEVGSSTHYHATYVKPKWARAMQKVGRIGLHVFYRTFRGGWS